MASGGFFFGAVLMVLWSREHRAFFDRDLEVADLGALERPPPARPAETAGVA